MKRGTSPGQIWYLLGICLICNMGIGSVLSSLAEGCYRKCRRTETPSNETLSQIELSTTSSICSCNSGCIFYRDCCLDSNYRTQEIIPARRIMCITLEHSGKYKAIAKCSSGSTVFCLEGIGHLPPVTSKKSGTTYANIHCAICNEDSEDLLIWNVDLRCCPEHDNLEDQSDRKFISRGRYLESVLERPMDNIPPTCTCSYYARDGDNSFTNSLELRICEQKPEISRCSTTWRNETLRRQCAAFLDPVYSSGNVYRNIYCAQCNYERLESLSCEPHVVKQLRSEGMKDMEILAHCKLSGLRNCIHFLNIQVLGRGRSYAFSSLLNINEKGCIPDAGKRCCAGERYDFRSKRCREVH